MSPLSPGIVKARSARTCFWLDINNRAMSAIAIIQFTPDNCDRRISILQAVIKLKIFSGRSIRFGGSHRSSLLPADKLAKLRDPSRSPSYEFLPRICFRFCLLTCPFPPLHTLTYTYDYELATDQLKRNAPISFFFPFSRIPFFERHI